MRTLLTTLAAVAFVSTASAQENCEQLKKQAEAYATSIKCEDLVPGWCAGIRRQYVETNTTTCKGLWLVKPPSFTLDVRIMN